MENIYAGGNFRDAKDAFESSPCNVLVNMIYDNVGLLEKTYQ